MSTKKTYGEKLLDPRWQKRRLQILDRDNWTCQICGETTKTLHVHHRYYGWQEPWDMEDRCLVTLCEVCHEVETAEYKTCADLLIDSIKFAGFFSNDLRHLAGGFQDMAMPHLSEVVASAIANAISNPEIMKLIMEKYFEQLSNNKKDEF